MPLNNYEDAETVMQMFNAEMELEIQQARKQAEIMDKFLEAITGVNMGSLENVREPNIIPFRARGTETNGL